MSRASTSSLRILQYITPTARPREVSAPVLPHALPVAQSNRPTTQGNTPPSALGGHQEAGPYVCPSRPLELALSGVSLALTTGHTSGPGLAA